MGAAVTTPVATGCGEPEPGPSGVWGEREYGAEGRLGRTGALGGREYGAEGSMGRREPASGAEGSLGAEGKLGRKAHPDKPTSTCALKPRHFSAARREAPNL